MTFYDLTNYDIFDTSDTEQLGTKEKYWVIHPIHKNNKKYLLKLSRPNTGEHWSEYISSMICDDLMIPHANYEMCLINDKYGQKRYGVLSEKIFNESFDMIMGNQFLFQSRQNDTSDDIFNTDKFNASYHTIDAVLNSISNVDIYERRNVNLQNTCDVFCGYLMLDALICNQDRHDENWAILQCNINGKLYLCPTYDHASSLATNISDLEKEERLSSKDKFRQVPHFVSKAKSALYHEGKKLTPLEAFTIALQHTTVSESAKKYWLELLYNNISESSINRIFNNIDDSIMSTVSKKFTLEMILCNKSRILLI